VADIDIGHWRYLARELGMWTDYWDVYGGYHEASVPAIVAVLQAMGLDAAPDDARPAEEAIAQRRSRRVQPVHVAWDADEAVIPLRLPEGVTRLRVDVRGDEGVDWSFDLSGDELGGWDADGHGPPWRRLVLPERLPFGYHRVRVEAGPEVFETEVFAAPRRPTPVAADTRWWGVFAPLYAVRHPGRCGPDLGDLDRLGAWAAALGAGVVGTLPLLATFLDRPFSPSPYSPASRRFWNELYLDLEGFAHAAAADEALDLLTDGPLRATFAELSASRRFDYWEHHLRRLPVLEALANHVASGRSPLSQAFRDHLAERREVVDYARFRACTSAVGRTWHTWGEPQRSGSLGPGDVDPALEHLHAVAQFGMHRQMGELAASFRTRDQRLYLDLPIGSHPDGFDAWHDQHVYAWGASVGAPPDEFFGEGQDWGFPPVDPWSSRQDGHRQFRAALHHHMSVAGVLRLDHVMGLYRLFWVPRGLSARDGIYVGMPAEELFAALCIEAHRHDCVVVGEDLGTVPDEVREAMHHHGLLGMYVAEFAQPSWPGAELGQPSPGSMASIDTHDTPTFAGFLHGVDVEARHGLGQLAAESVSHAMTERAQQRTNLLGFLRARGYLDDGGAAADDDGDAEVREDLALGRALLACLADSDAAAVLVTLEDLWGEREAQNLPGTPDSRPNWVQRFPDSLDEVTSDPALADVLRTVHQCRLAARERARGG
jgi:4-alpha-glucanotransferase